MDIIGSEWAKVQNVTPGAYVFTWKTRQFERVLEYPVVTGRGVFVNLSGDVQIGPLPLDDSVEVAVWG